MLLYNFKAAAAESEAGVMESDSDLFNIASIHLFSSSLSALSSINIVFDIFINIVIFIDMVIVINIVIFIDMVIVINVVIVIVVVFIGIVTVTVNVSVNKSRKSQTCNL